MYVLAADAIVSDLTVNEFVPQLVATLGRWLPDSEQAQFCALGQGSSFSGAGLWRVEHAGQAYVLRCWPEAASDRRSLERICWLQRHLADAALPVAGPLAMTAGEDAVVLTQIGLTGKAAAWTLTPWLPGVADYWTYPRPARLKRALGTLAEIHRAAAAYPLADRSGPPRSDRSPALIRRADRLEALKAGEWAELNYHLAKITPSDERELAFETLELIQRSLGRLWNESLQWSDVPLPLQWVIRDVWHDHLLFTEDRVTGVIDFGAAAVDSPAGDVARLLGSLVGDDAEGWRAGLAAYVAVRPLSELEREAIRFFDATGTLLSAFNWVHWLFRDQAAVATVDRTAAIGRLERLATRLRRLA